MGKMVFKGSVIVGLLFFAFGTLLSYRLGELRQDQRQNQIAPLAAQHSSLGAQALNDQLLRLHESLVHLNQVPSGRDDILAMAQIKITDRGQWEVKKFSQKSGLAWTEAQVTQILPGLPLARVTKDELGVARINDPTLGQAWVLMGAMGGDGGLRLTFLAVNYFSGYHRPLRGQPMESYAVDSQGMALTFPQEAYVGAKVTDHPLVKKLVTQNKPADVMNVRDPRRGPAVAAYRRLENANVFFVTVIPIASGTGAVFGWLTEMGLIAFGFFLLLVIAMGALLIPYERAWLAIRRTLEGIVIAKGEVALPSETVRDRRMLETLSKLQAGWSDLVGRSLAAAHPTDAAAAVASPPAEEEVEKAIENVGRRVAGALRGPLSAILGHIQMARALNADAQANPHFQAIEQEARKGRDLVENLGLLGSEKATLRGPYDLQDLVLRSLGGVREELSQKQIKLNKKIDLPAKVMVNDALLVSALDQLLSYMIETLEKWPTREMTISTSDLGDRIRLVLQDTGPGVAVDDFSQGMGLSIARGLIRQMQGDLRCESESGKGASFIIDLPLAAQSGEPVSFQAMPSLAPTRPAPPPPTKPPPPAKPSPNKVAQPNPEPPEEAKVTQEMDEPFPVLIRPPKVRMGQ